MELYSAIKRNDLIHPTGMNLKNMPLERGLTQKLHTIWLHLYELPENTNRRPSFSFAEGERNPCYKL